MYTYGILRTRKVVPQKRAQAHASPGTPDVHVRWGTWGCEPGWGGRGGAPYPLIVNGRSVNRIDAPRPERSYLSRLGTRLRRRRLLRAQNTIDSTCIEKSHSATRRGCACASSDELVWYLVRFVCRRRVGRHSRDGHRHWSPTPSTRAKGKLGKGRQGSGHLGSQGCTCIRALIIPFLCAISCMHSEPPVDQRDRERPWRPRGRHTPFRRRR